MARCSNAVVCFVSFLSLIVAVPLICFGYWLKSEAKGECQRSTPMAILIIGATLLILSLLGIFGSCCCLNFFLGIYLFFMTLAIIVMLAYIAFNVVVTAKMDEHQPGSDYKLESSSGWLQKHVLKNWDETEKCIKELKMCDDAVMNAVHERKAGSRFIKDQITPVQIGCCKPADECGFTYVNASYWEVPSSGVASAMNADCKRWSNKEDEKCYGCESCKAGMIASTKGEWKRSVWIEIATVVYLILIYCIAACAFRNNQASKH